MKIWMSELSGTKWLQIFDILMRVYCQKFVLYHLIKKLSKLT